MRSATKLFAVTLAASVGASCTREGDESRDAALPDATADDAGPAPDTSGDGLLDGGDATLDTGADLDGADGDATLDTGADLDGADGDATDDAGDGGIDAGIECAAPLAACLDGDGVYRCVDLRTEHCHCGACGNRCTVGPCFVGVCAMCGEDATPRRWCAPHRDDPACISGDSDPATLGCTNITTTIGCLMCGIVCEPPHAVPYCDPAAALLGEDPCTIGICYAGWGNCDGLAENGCETDLNGSPLSCGDCGRACPSATPRCVGGSCAP